MENYQVMTANNRIPYPPTSNIQVFTFLSYSQNSTSFTINCTNVSTSNPQQYMAHIFNEEKSYGTSVEIPSDLLSQNYVTVNMLVTPAYSNGSPVSSQKHSFYNNYSPKLVNTTVNYYGRFDLWYICLSKGPSKTITFRRTNVSSSSSSNSTS